MFSSLSSSLVFSTIEYFSYLNLWLIILFLFLCLFFLIFSSCQLVISSILCSGAVFEFSLIFVSFLFVVIIITPALIILLDSEIIIIPSFIVYSCGYQWAWTFSFYYLNWISNCDHYLYSSYYLLNHYLYSSFYHSISSSSYHLCYSSSSYHLVNQLQCSYAQWSFYSSFFLSFFLSYFYTMRFLISATRYVLFSWAELGLAERIASNTLSSIIYAFNFVTKLNAVLIKAQLNYAVFALFTCCNTFLLVLSNIYLHDSLFILALFTCYNTFLLVLATSISLFNALISNLAFLFCYLCYSSTSSMNSSLYLNALSNFNTYLFYFFTCNTTILIPILSTIRFFVFSYDVIHSLGIYSFGIKIDAIPGRFNFASTIRTTIKGAHYGFCFELCGHGHSSMLIVGKTLINRYKSSALRVA